MLPSSKRKGDDEIELGDEDLIVVESSSSRRAGRPRQMTPSGALRILDEAVEEDVAGECLRDLRERIPRSAFPAQSPLPRAAGAEEGPRMATPSAPRLSQAWPTPRTTAPAAFVRRSSPMIPVSADASTDAARALHAPGTASSVAPLSMSPRTAKPRVILLRERPKAVWVLAAAVVGALCAFGATRLLPAPSEAPGALGPGAPPGPVAPLVTVAPAAPPAVAVLSAAPVTAPAPSVSAVVMRFRDDQAVAIIAAPRPVAAPPRARPSERASSRNVSMPEESAVPSAAPGMGRSANVPAAAPPVTAAEAAKKRAAQVIIEEQLAEEQLKASMQ